MGFQSSHPLFIKNCGCLVFQSASFEGENRFVAGMGKYISFSWHTTTSLNSGSTNFWMNVVYFEDVFIPYFDQVIDIQFSRKFLPFMNGAEKMHLQFWFIWGKKITFLLNFFPKKCAYAHQISHVIIFFFLWQKKKVQFSRDVWSIVLCNYFFLCRLHYSMHVNKMCQKMMQFQSRCLSQKHIFCARQRPH